ncbi:hypothetical protein MKEN_00932200 [Mycena kentingensis (nom. inval.)]|nr:hypothetical protein MKEN_00931000 [Mycena kentingensis (nom. inval.)]KAF7314587.1 hypothetical protein MKEN_00932200 [Mycena kentingensis (nom. inval.)]
MRVHKIKPEAYRTLSAARIGRNPGRRDGSHWNAHSFLCPAQVDGFRRDARDGATFAPELEEADCEECTAHVVFPERRDVNGESVDLENMKRREVGIWEIARVAKAKGVAKEFEVVRAPQRVIALNDDEDEDLLSIVSDAFTNGDVDLDSAMSEGWEDGFSSDSDSDFELVDSDSDDDYSGLRRQQRVDEDFLFARRLQEEEDARFARGMAGG